MTDFIEGQAVTLPHQHHTAGGIVRRVYVDDSGAQRVEVEAANGVRHDYLATALYASTADREAARNAALSAAARDTAAAMNWKGPR